MNKAEIEIMAKNLLEDMKAAYNNPASTEADFITLSKRAKFLTLMTNTARLLDPEISKIPEEETDSEESTVRKMIRDRPMIASTVAELPE